MHTSPTNVFPLRPDVPGFAPLVPACAVPVRAPDLPPSGAPPADVPPAARIGRRAMDLISAIGAAWMRLPLASWCGVLARLQADGRDPGDITLGELVQLLQAEAGTVRLGSRRMGKTARLVDMEDAP